MNELDELRVAVALLKAERDMKRLQSYHSANQMTGKPWSNDKEKTA